jgi:hypothetical protein
MPRGENSEAAAPATTVAEKARLFINMICLPSSQAVFDKTSHHAWK